MNRLIECDYVIDKNGNIYIVRGYNNLKNILVNLVFKPSKEGRFNPLLKRKYKKVIDENIVPIFLNIKKVDLIFRPKERFPLIYKKLDDTLWKEIADFLIGIGIKRKELGVFGSTLVGFEISKDVDFVIYGIENYDKVKQNIEKLKVKLKIKSISKKHIRYQIEKHAKQFSKSNSFFLMLKNKWSSMQINKKILATVRFVYRNKEIPEDILIKKGKEIIISGKVFESWRTDFSPRIFKLKTKGGRVYRILTYFWIYQSCVKDGQKIRIKGELNKKNNTVYLSKFKHWIKILK